MPIAESATVHYFVAYATRSGAAALEPEGGAGRNGYFTAALLPFITSHGVDMGVRQLLPMVRDWVFDRSRRTQKVEVRDELVGGDVFLLPSTVGSALAGDDSGPVAKRARCGDGL